MSDDEPRVELMVMFDRATKGSSWGIFDMPTEMTDLVFGSDDEEDGESDECPCECGCCKPLCEDANACDGDEGKCCCWHMGCECGVQLGLADGRGYN